MLGVVMTQGDVGPVFQMQIPATDGSGSVLRGDMAERVLSRDLEVCHKHLIFLGPFGLEHWRRRRQDRLPRDGKDAEIKPGVDQPPRLVGGYIDTQLFEEPEDRTRLYGARGIMVARDEDNRRAWERLTESLELLEGKDDGIVGGAN